MSLSEQLTSHLTADDLRPVLALYFSHRGPNDLPAIHIKLHGLEQGQAVSTIRLDHIAGLEADPRQLAGRSFSFPLNPADGYIDGSVYLQGRHQAVDVTRLAFGMEKNLQIPLEVTGSIQFEELPLPLEFHFSVPLQLPLGQTAMLALLEATMQATSACAPTDMGRLMAYLKQHVHYEEQIADLAVLAKARLTALAAKK